MRRCSLLLLLSAVFPLAFAFSPSSVTVTAVVGPDGIASVREDYFFFFRDANEFNAFRSFAELLGNSFQLWIANVEGVDFHLGRDYRDLSNISLYWGEIGPNAAKLTVRYSVRAAVLSRETPTEAEYVITAFHIPRQSGAYVIPRGVSIVLVLPQQARIISYEPEVEESRRGTNMITWEGPITTNKIYVRYAVPKPAVAPSLFELLLNTSYSVYISILFVVLAAVLFLKRDKVRSLIQGYVEQNSQFEE
ncbi:TPA: hypothetical protein EYP13_00875 [Candidatus Micrarchaeota archaeon]|nr:hypothetical protein [Candidatus Micrarchaeota archaeon]